MAFPIADEPTRVNVIADAVLRVAWRPSLFEACSAVVGVVVI
jgi:hypothetical protein